MRFVYLKLVQIISLQLNPLFHFSSHTVCFILTLHTASFLFKPFNYFTSSNSTPITSLLLRLQCFVLLVFPLPPLDLYHDLSLSHTQTLTQILSRHLRCSSQRKSSD